MVVTKVRETIVTTTITEAVVTPVETGQPSTKIISEKANSKVKMRAEKSETCYFERHCRPTII